MGISKKMQDAERGLTKAQRSLLDRVRAGHWYEAHDPKTPKAMEELVRRGLVGTMGRVASIKSCYVPKGAKPLKRETLPPFECSHFHSYWTHEVSGSERRCSNCYGVLETILAPPAPEPAKPSWLKGR